MSKTKFACKEDQSLALRMHAEGHTPKNICDYFDSEKKPHPSASSLTTMFKNKCHLTEINRYREEYYARIKDVPISHKRTRLEIRQKLMISLEKALDKMLNKGGEIKKKDFNKVLKLISKLDGVLAGAQEEMEKKPGTIVQLTQHFGQEKLTMEEILSEERRIIAKIAELKRAGISLPRGAIQPIEAAEEKKNNGEPS